MKNYLNKKYMFVFLTLIVLNCVYSPSIYASESNVSNIPIIGEIDEIYEGTCGENLTWSLDTKTGELVISGVGEMQFDSNAPWYQYQEYILTIVINDSVTSIADSAFYYCTKATSITIPNSVCKIGAGAFYHCEQLISLDIPDGVSEIAPILCADCYNLKSVSIPNSVTSIGGSAFSDCSVLNNIIIPENVVKIGAGAFDHTAIRSIKIPYGITSIEEGTFNWCFNLQDIYIPETVTSIGKNAFKHCVKLNKIMIPYSVTWIKPSAFTECYYITDVYYSGSKDEWNQIEINTENNWLIDANRHYIPQQVTRFYGKGRYETSLLMADELKEELGVNKFDSVIVACGTNFADALGGSYLATTKKAPILLAGSTEKRINAVISYIKENLKPEGTVYILGGESAVSLKLDSDLSSFNIKRLAGTDRYGTNVEILKEAGVPLGSEIIVATGKDYADSLSASSVGKPLFLVKSKLTKEQIAFLKTLKNASFTIIGGKAVVTEDMEKVLSSYGKMNARLAGSNRFATSIMVAKKYFNDPNFITLVYSHGFPDGLSAGPYAAEKRSPVVLTRTASIGKGAEAYIKGLSYVKEGYIIGGPTQISDEAAITLFDLMNKKYIDIIYRAE